MVSTSSTVRRLLVANRGEVAQRVFRTCRDLGVATVAVHSDADAALPFVREADIAVRLPGHTPSETYLRGDLLVEAALRTGADAVHPGYGFLSESAGFARQVLAAGLTWVGPTPESMEQMASKVEAKKLMAAAGVPVLAELSPSEVTEADLPLLVKASAGGGGRGMRVVRSLGEVAAAVAQASEEALSAFGDATVFCEPYVRHGRHVEVQLLGDSHGAVVVVGDRDCSVQRRHQKVVEEAPAPGLSDGLRAAMHEAARAAGEAIGYVGAGTVEFLLEGRSFFFLEMNTRLQVEHPVTELTVRTGGRSIDLVEQQLLVAEGAHVPEVASPRGHAVEVRLYAEDPAHDWRPQSGRLSRFEIMAGPGLRVDTGFESGSEVSTHYDALLAKVVAWADTRQAACRRLAAALDRARIHGVSTNRELLVEVLRHEAFVAGGVGTDFLERHALASMAPRRPDDHTLAVATFAAAVTLAQRAVARTVQARIPTGWRNVVAQPQRAVFRLGYDQVEAAWLGTRTGPVSADGTLRADLVDGRGTVTGPTGAVRVEVHLEGDRVDVESGLGHVAMTVVPRFLDPADRVAGGSLLAPMPGSVVRVEVGTGQRVTAGQAVLVLEAMKMQHTVTAPHDGEVTEIPVGVGSHVAAGEVLAVVSTSSTNQEETDE